MADRNTLTAAFADLLTTIEATAAHLESQPFYAEGENRVGAYLFLLGDLISRFEEAVIFDAEFPSPRVLDTRIREGGDNPDQRYLFSNILGSATYRIWGRLGAARRVDLQIYAGTPYIAGSGGRAASFFTFEQMHVEADGYFEVIASPEPQAGNWIENLPDATRIIVRQIYSDWTDAWPGEVHIDRIGAEGDLRPALTEGVLIERMQRAAKSIADHGQWWPEHVIRHYLSRNRPNRISPPFDPGAVGGVWGRYMCSAVFELDPDEALVLRTWPMDGNYQGTQLTDMWFSSLEYANRQTSLTGDQSFLSSDGSYYSALAPSHLGIANWLDTIGRRRGVILLRFDGMSEPFDPAKNPVATVVKLASLREDLPADTPVVTATERAQAIAARRRQVQVRFSH